MKKQIETIQRKFGVIGREEEIANLIYCIFAQKNVLLEGPVGVGKTFLVSAVAEELGRKLVRIDGDTRYTEQKMTGWFDPPTVLKKGYSRDAYFKGPLTEAMQEGAILFINELNRMPEGVQNILLPAMDEQKIMIPRIGEIKAKEGFLVLATQNPREFVATTHISEALLDRFELILLGYQKFAEEAAIMQKLPNYQKDDKELVSSVINIVRNTRKNPKFRRGASIRAAISIYELAKQMGGSEGTLLKACQLALPTRVELSDEIEGENMAQIIKSIVLDSKKKD